MRKTIFYIILILTIGLIPSWLQYGCFVCIGDYINQQIPFILETKKMLASGVPFWSWNTYFGDNFWADYSFYTWTSPFVWIDCLFPREWMPLACTFTLYLKYIVLGCLTWMYFRKMNVREDLRLIGTLMFCFSSFVVTNTFYYHFLEPIMAFIILLLAIERFLRKKKYGTLGIGLASFLVVAINYYFAPCSFIPALIYSIARVCGDRSLADGKRICIGLLSVFAGILIAMPIAIPAFIQLIESNRATGHNKFMWQLGDRIGTLFIPKLREGAIPLLDYAYWNSTAMFIPVVGILFAGMYVIRERNWLTWVICIFLICYVSPINGIFSLWTNTNYTRWAYAFCLMAILGSLYYLSYDRKLTWKPILILILITGVVVLYRCKLLLIYPIRGLIIPTGALYEHGMMLGYLVLSLLCLILYKQYSKIHFLRVLVVLMCMVQVLGWSYLGSDDFVRRTRSGRYGKEVFHAQISENTAALSDYQQNYRTDFVDGYPNSPLLKNAPGMSSFHSVFSTSYDRIFLVMDSTRVKFRDDNHSVNPTIHRSSLDALMSVRNVICYNDSSTLCQWNLPLTFVNRTDRYATYHYDNYIPFGFAYDRWMRQSVIDTLLAQKSKTDLPLLMLNALAIEDDDVSALSPYMVEMEDVTDTLCLADICAVRNRHTASHVEWTTRGFSCDVDGDSTMVWWFSALAEPGFTATIDGVETKIYPSNCSFSAIIVPAGRHHIVFDFFPPGLKLGLILMVIGMALLITIVSAKNPSE